jgi:two-component system, response regulator YesN
MDIQKPVSRYTVIIVDDEKSIRTGLGYLIRSSFRNVDIVEAANGLEAMGKLRSQPSNSQPVLMILDIRMPGMDGLALCKKMKDEQLCLKTAIISGYKDFEYAQQSIRYGVADYLLKPVNPSDILRIVSDAVVDAQKTGEETALMNTGETQCVVEAVRAWIHDHLDQDITLLQVAEGLHYSPNYLSTLFKRVIGKGFQEYLTECRMKRARHLLKDPTLRVYEICRSVGYTNAKAFSVAFRKAYGITPTEDRNSIHIISDD